MKIVFQVLAIIAWSWTACTGLMAQSPILRMATSSSLSGQKPAGTFTLHSRVDLVVLHATVLDKNGHHVEGLQKNDFQVYENGTPQKLAVFSHADVPVTVGILIDDSGSMRIVRPSVNAAAWSFVKTSNPADQVFVVTFNQAYDFDLPGPFATDTGQLRTALNHHIESRGGTALYDAVYASLEHLHLGSHDQKKALLVITDGDDNASAHTLSQLIRYEEQSAAQVYVVGLLEGGGYLPGEDYEMNIMKKMADVTGAKALFPTSLTQVDQVCDHVAHLIRDQYTLGYYPTNVARDGSFRRIKVVALEPNTDEPLIVKTRLGYYAPEGNPLATSSARKGVNSLGQNLILTARNHH
ncbi:MAG TPA: VWA domain-containing protein [Terriglobia bacterium]|nr:VWA domain-containing protein [Terriglobia bacterium]